MKLRKQVVFHLRIVQILLIAEYGDNGSIDRKRVYGMDLISMERGGESYYYHKECSS